MLPLVKTVTNSPVVSAAVQGNYNIPVFNVSVHCVVTGTITYTIQVTNDDALDSTVTPNWSSASDAALVAATTTVFGNITRPYRFARVSTSAGTGTVVATFLQQG